MRGGSWLVESREDNFYVDRGQARAEVAVRVSENRDIKTSGNGQAASIGERKRVEPKGSSCPKGQRTGVEGCVRHAVPVRGGGGGKVGMRSCLGEMRTRKT